MMMRLESWAGGYPALQPLMWSYKQTPWTADLVAGFGDIVALMEFSPRVCLKVHILSLKEQEAAVVHRSQYMRHKGPHSIVKES